MCRSSALGSGPTTKQLACASKYLAYCPPEILTQSERACRNQLEIWSMYRDFRVGLRKQFFCGCNTLDVGGLPQVVVDVTDMPRQPQDLLS